MKHDNRPVSYQQTLGTKTEIIKERTEQKEQNQSTQANNLENADANFPE